ncbi:SdpA family antimicrobial peptide system protein [Hymenobacter aquaticus]|uniref:SdpA family antimicrobial peptide system protein n=1 Tax=Hymenobacter aquaticus TaxID=1867101 RepID=A0A4Z0Q6W6_9BACT|nr:SdpA family antimicrobial peptide system protein [Hymenobacter aquaticus]TGE25414.1 SdpA family antimicrobial peptide system protein [Hymenobacter aquaticus]
MKAKRFVFYLTLIILGFVLVAKAGQASVGTNATETSFQERYMFSVLLPEGWGFFTKNPRDAKTVLYTVGPDKTLALATYKNAAAQNLCGLSRRSRRLNLEFSRVMAQVQEKDWTRQQAYSLTELLHADTIAAVVIPYSTRHFTQLAKGDYVVKRFNVVPWAWAQYPEHFTNPEQYLKLTIK